MAFFCVLLMLSCKHKEDEYHSITDKIEALSKDYKGVSVSSSSYTSEIKTIEITEGEHSFSIPERKSQIKSYACTECHSKPMAEMKSKDFKKAHWNIKLNHAQAETMNCVSCHDSKNTDNLHSLTGASIDFNRSYKLCSQCHSKEFKDWKGGAHGKTIASWAPPRVAKTCVNCHNPHDPGFKKRWPVQFNSHIEKERE